MKIRTANFMRKADARDLLPTEVFVVRKTVILDVLEFEAFKHRSLLDYDFIAKNKDLMYVDKNGVWNCIFVTTEEANYGFLIESEGYDYARYMAFIYKEALK